MSFVAIHQILDARLLAVPNLPIHQSENTLIKPANVAAWCRSTLLPAATTTESIGASGRERKNGIYQIDLFYVTNSGYTAAGTMADSIVSSFSKGLYLTDSIYTPMVLRSYINSARPFNNYMQLPVIVEWECFV